MGIFNFFKRNKVSGPKFEVGEAVICIDDREHRVVYNKTKMEEGISIKTKEILTKELANVGEN